MAKIYAPNKDYTGISAGVHFSQGVGECTNPYLIDWFRARGYRVEEIEGKLKNMSIKELKAYAEEKEIKLGKATSKEGILKKILEAEKDVI